MKNKENEPKEVIKFIKKDEKEDNKINQEFTPQSDNEIVNYNQDEVGLFDILSPKLTLKDDQENAIMITAGIKTLDNQNEIAKQEVEFINAGSVKSLISSTTDKDVYKETNELQVNLNCSAKKRIEDMNNLNNIKGEKMKQSDIAEKTKTSQGYVSKVLNKKNKDK